jgi:hypothetical protein
MTVLPKLTVPIRHRRMEFAECAQNNEASFYNIWFSDEAHFHLDGLVNEQNVRFWVSENPHMIHEKVHHTPRITVWVTISIHGLLGPIFFEETMSSEPYLSVFATLLCLTFLPQVCCYKLSGSCRWNKATHSKCCFFGDSLRKRFFQKSHKQ